MFRYLAAAVLFVLPSGACAGQATSQFTVGIRIIPDSAAQKSARTTRGLVKTTTGTPFRRYTVRDGDGRRIDITEF